MESVYPFAKWTMIGLLCGRMVLLLISIKCLSITKIYFYYELLVVLVKQCLLPQDQDTHRGNLFLNHVQQNNFSEFYFHLWPSLLSLAVP